MTKASVNLQDLRRRIYLKAKAEKSWRFWGLYVHVCKMETLREAYQMARSNGGAPGSEGGTVATTQGTGRGKVFGRNSGGAAKETDTAIKGRKADSSKDLGDQEQAPA